MTRPTAEMAAREKLERKKVLEERIEAWEAAYNLFQPIALEHGIEVVKNGAMFGPFYASTKVEQHVTEVIRIANWLMGVE